MADLVTALPALPPRPPDANKGTFGRVLVVAGSVGMAGAAALTASAALRGGAGLVYLAVPSEILTTVAALNPCYLTIPLSADRKGQLARRALPEVRDAAQGKDVVALGPGLGPGDVVARLVREVVREVAAPLVLDADGLNALQGQTDLLKERPGPAILTPHPGEFARLVGVGVADVQARRHELAVAFAAEHRVTLVLKGHGTLVTDGRRLVRNPTGNPGMATGGTGDVLTGLVAALVGQGLEPFAASQLGAYLHGRAGDLARDDLGEPSLIATDLLTYLPRAFLSLQTG